MSEKYAVSLKTIRWTASPLCTIFQIKIVFSIFNENKTTNVNH